MRNLYILVKGLLAQAYDAIETKQFIDKWGNK